MKKTGIILQAIIAVAVIVLYVLHFTGKGGGKSSSVSNDTTALKLGQGAVAYVNLDSVMAQYDMTKDLSKELEAKGKQFDSELKQKSSVWQNNVQDFQYKAQRGLEVSSKLQEMEKQLQDDQQKLLGLRDNYGAQLQEENSVMLRKVLNSVMDYLKEYNKEKNFSFVFGNQFDGKILYANPGLDITAEVVKGLNEKYAEQKKSGK